MRANGVPAVWLTPPQYASTKTIMWMHGGAFIFCHTGTHARLLSSLGAAADAKVLSVEYSLCPDEGRYADMLREVTRAYEWLVDADGGGAMRTELRCDGVNGTCEPPILLTGVDVFYDPPEPTRPVDDLNPPGLESSGGSGGS